jgi:pimeloyl-ACP methyl ester carboxylesterase
MRESREWSVTTDDGIRLHVEQWPAAAAGAPLVLALHGITANRRGFLPLVEELAGEVELVAYDARGRGSSDKPDDPARYGHRRHAEDAAAVLGAEGRPADDVVGQSMGAWDGL